VNWVDDIADDGASGTGIKNVTANEKCFTGHFPALPVMPCVLMLEAMAQTAVLVGSTALGEGRRGAVVYLAGVDEARFKSRVVPSDQLKIKVERMATRAGFEKWRVEAYVGERLAASAVLSAMRP
jgi:3-hydroxyacyl-[acyl-carrier-protein] dehydratase